MKKQILAVLMAAIMLVPNLTVFAEPVSEINQSSAEQGQELTQEPAPTGCRPLPQSLERQG